jgi:hypothetical protein
MPIDLKVFNDILADFTTSVISDARNNLAAEGKGGSNLANSIDGRIKVMKNSVLIEFEMAEYGFYVDRGVDAAGGQQYQGGGFDPLSDETPFSFANYKIPSKGMVRNLANWMESKGRTFDSEGDKHRAGFSLGLYIRENGIPKTLFFTEAYRKHFNKLPQALIDKYGFEIDKLYNFLIR